MNLDCFSKYLQLNFSIQDSFVFDSQTLKNIYNYFLIFKKWNDVINLSAHRKDEAIILNNFIDSLYFSHFFIQKKLNSKIKIVDFGSGAGFPSLVLNIIDPNLSIYYVEADQKKSAFLNTVLIQQNLKNSLVVNEYWNENGIAEKYQFFFDVFVSRGTMDVVEMEKIAFLTLKDFSCFFPLLSEKQKENIGSLKYFERESIFDYTLPLLNKKFSILSLKKK